MQFSYGLALDALRKKREYFLISRNIVNKLMFEQFPVIDDFVLSSNIIKSR